MQTEHKLAPAGFKLIFHQAIVFSLLVLLSLLLFFFWKKDTIGSSVNLRCSTPIDFMLKCWTEEDRQKDGTVGEWFSEMLFQPSRPGFKYSLRSKYTFQKVLRPI